MKTATNPSLVFAFIVVIALFVLLGGGALTGVVTSGGMNGNGWMGEPTWMWPPLLLTLGLGVALSWFIFKKKQ